MNILIQFVISMHTNKSIKFLGRVDGVTNVVNGVVRSIKLITTNNYDIVVVDEFGNDKSVTVEINN